MAHVSTIFCTVCGIMKREVINHTGKCNACVREERSKARRIHLAALKGLTLEERLVRLEENEYDQAHNVKHDYKIY